jgi:hypothetical protein
MNCVNILTVPRILEMKGFRAGIWSESEYAYAILLANCFKAGLFGDVAPGSSLRQWLALQLNCDVMRVSKKFRKSKVLSPHRYSINWEKLRLMTASDKDTISLKLEKAAKAYQESLKIQRYQQLWPRERHNTLYAVLLDF